MISSQKKIMIIDNEHESIEKIKMLLQGYSNLKVVSSTTNSLDALKEVRLHEPDLIFIHIEMPEKNGFDVLNDIIEAKILPQVIFISSFEKSAIDAIRCCAFDYLIKPINPQDLHNALLRFYNKTVQSVTIRQQHVFHEKSLSHCNKLKFNTHTGFFMLAPEEIVFIQADWNYSELFISETLSELVTINLGKLEEMLPKGVFFRINRSIIINMNYLIRVNRKKKSLILMKDGKEFSFKVPLLNIRKIENYIDESSSI